MKHLIIRSVCLLLFIIFVGQARAVYGWQEHPMMIYPILRDMPEMRSLPEVPVKSLLSFLLEEESGLAVFLAGHEEWARSNVAEYAPRPDALAFQATGDATDILQRFYRAIRVNPNVKVELYLHLLPGDDPGMRDLVNPYALTTLSNIYEMLHTTYVRLHEGEMVSPIAVLATATDEPDYGFDLGLFTDNGTSWGEIYGFGEQSFGNPALEYGSQAPFHMGFYHESWLVFAAASFLKRTFVEYRIHLYKSLAEYAFDNGQDYWGYRFLGWAMHYLNDMSMPYHTSVMPAKGPLAMIWINLKAMLGFPRSRDNAIQLLSNRHTVYEHFQWIILREAHETGSRQHPFIQALMNPVEHVDYHIGFAREVAARESYRVGKRNDRILRRNVPAHLVSDPENSISGSADLTDLREVIVAENGDEAVDALTDMIAERFRSLSMHTRSFVLANLPDATAR